MVHRMVSFDLLENTIGRTGEDSASKWASHYDGVKPILRAVISDALTVRQRQVCIMYFYKSMNTVEIAELLSVNKSTVSRTLARALKNINDRVKYYTLLNKKGS